MTEELEATVAALATGAVTARQLLARCVARLEAENPRLNAVVTTDLPGAEAAADAADARRRAGAALGPLDGVPFTVKDNLFVGGMRATWGSRLFADHVAPADDLCVARLRAAGAVMLGKTNTPEFALAAHTSNEIFGATRNPWDATRVPGGSSGGAAAAVATGIAPLALGTDAGGSIRLPAAHCGVTGFRPSVGLIPRLHGFPPLALDFQAIGVMTHRVRGVRMAMEVLAGPDARDRASLAFGGLRAATPGPLAIRLSLGAPGATVDPEVAGLVHDAARVLAGLGHRVAEGPMPHDGASLVSIRSVLSSAGVARVVAAHPGWEGLVTPAIRAAAEKGLGIPAAQYVAALDALADWRAATAAAMQGVDILATPVCPVPAWPIEAPTAGGAPGMPAGPPDAVAFTAFANAMGWPAISVPCGLTKTGLPVGLQLVAPYGEDHQLLALAEAYQSATAWHALRPPPPRE
ncbi:amidase [Falsiroseomonas oryzae]|uniref:amidase n=1 Tax=Falsiroseomonas oryzae TaxID=2766473 RepID=UPI0022EA70E2|nr:amidase [Roseomonas sp. MO-31]